MNRVNGSITGRSVSRMAAALHAARARLRMFRVSFLSVCRRKGRRCSSHSSVANVPQISVALSHPGMALGLVCDCVGMRSSSYVPQAMRHSALRLLRDYTTRPHCERASIHFERVEKHREASALPADLQEQDTCHRYLTLSYPLSL